MKRGDEPVPQWTAAKPRKWRDTEYRQREAGRKRTFSGILTMVEAAVELVARVVIALIEGLSNHHW